MVTGYKMSYVTAESAENGGMTLMKRFLVICGNQADRKYDNGSR